VHTAGKKNHSTGVWFKQVILNGFLRLDLQPVQLIFPTSITDKIIPQPSKDILFSQRAPRGGKKGRGNSTVRRALQTAVLFPQRAE
jgi:hypothetical protein